MSNAKGFCSLLLALTYGLCLFCFGLNVATTLADFFSWETIQASALNDIEEFHWPEVVVCDSRFYIDPEMSMLTVEQYKNNTFDPSKLVISAEMNLEVEVKAEEIFTRRFGWCMLFHFDPNKVTARKGLFVNALLRRHKRIYFR